MGARSPRNLFVRYPHKIDVKIRRHLIL